MSAKKPPDRPPQVVLLHKPWGVLSQFTMEHGHPSLAGLGLPEALYPAGRLDRDSEGLLVLTNHGPLQARISAPRGKWPKTYWAQLEGEINDQALQALAQGVVLKDGQTLPARAERLVDPEIAERDPPIRQRRNQPTSWIALTLCEGRNRQVRRMTAHVGFPTLRLIRVRIGPLRLHPLAPGRWRALDASEIAALWRWRPESGDAD